MHRRKVQSVDQSDPAEMSLTISGQATQVGGPWQLTGNCWIKSEDGKTVVIKLEHDVLMALRDAIEDVSNSENMEPGKIKFTVI